MALRFFRSAAAFRAWLAGHHDSAREIRVGLRKRAAGRIALTYAAALDEALAFGWIDGVRTSVDAERYTIRFSPRKPRSIWSAVNIKRAVSLIERGAMAPPGQAAFDGRDRAKVRKYSYENRPRQLGEPYARRFREHASAWSFFTAQPPSYQRTATWWIVSAVKEETRLSRLQRLVDVSAAGRRLDMLSPARPPRSPRRRR